MGFVMDIREAARLFHEGVINRIQAVHDPVKSEQWLLQIETHRKTIFSISTVRHETKSYKTLEAVAADVLRITGRLTSMEFKS